MGGKKRSVRIIAAALLLISLALCLGGCGPSDPGRWPITDVNDLKGRRVGVNLSWEADYYLTGRKDMTLLRYDSSTDMAMALECNIIDAVAVDILSIKCVQVTYTGIRVVEEPLGYSGYILYFNDKNVDLRDDFNAFLAEYKQTEAFEDHMRRLEAFDGINYEDPVPELTGTGETIRVAIDAESFPRAFQNAEEEAPKGFDLEVLKLFANARNYRLEFIISSYDDIVYGIESDMYDVGAGYLSDVFTITDVDSGVLPSEALDTAPMYFVQKIPGEPLRLITE